MSDQDEPAAGIDLDHLARQTGGDAGLEAEVLALFEAQCARLGPLIRDGSVAERREAAHALRGASLAIGAWRLAGVAAALDHDATSAATAAMLDGILADLDDALREAREAIAVHRADSQEGPATALANPRRML